MKIAIICSSVLLKQALSLFLKDYISSYKGCDFVICDKKISIEKPSFLIGNFEDSHLKIPFSKANLQINLEKFYNQINQDSSKNGIGRVDLNDIKIKISQACQRFEQEILQIIKDSYES